MGHSQLRSTKRPEENKTPHPKSAPSPFLFHLLYHIPNLCQLAKEATLTVTHVVDGASAVEVDECGPPLLSHPRRKHRLRHAVGRHLAIIIIVIIIIIVMRSSSSS
jgi:hypothetical protein